MKRTDLLNAIRPGKRRMAVEMALQPGGVTASQMVATLGMPHTNSLQGLHLQGLATLQRARAANGHLAYCLLTDENLTAWQLQNQRLRAEAFKRMQAEPEPDADDDAY